MSRKTAFIKVSGDLHTSKEFVEFVRKLSKDFFVAVCVGGGTSITESGIPATFGPLGREIASFPDRQKARDILEIQQAELQDIFAVENISAGVIIPVLDVYSVLCHQNGDTMVELAYLGYDQLFVVTLPERFEKKIEEFKHLPRVTVVVCKS